MKNQDYIYNGFYYHRCGQKLLACNEHTVIRSVQMWCKKCKKNVILEPVEKGRIRKNY